ncbi:DUF2784 domain-containing protein [Bailinhaonella thermotolerans]|uniref:DUF2784 domain-containing protein n=1 Tax=Bailinhaonella thermotolerans TaxID=1070861 RepID=A0A3A4AZC1_9ACTN|nr:DUF2784 domain-containing protein [Bailinhaonella thermotolerans]RJL24722.1 DUF2784 domain-containing protein [Bailinhaonella thermotolerans]
MGYRLLADGAMVVHFAFLAYVVLGGYLAWRWPRTIWLHLACAAWGLASVTLRLECPLTHAEHWARVRAGERGLPPSGFIDHYIEGVIYPQAYAGALQALAALAVAVSWGVLAARLIRTRRAGKSAPRVNP